MIHLLGMSHAINVLKACSREPLAFSHDDWVSFNTAGRFFDVPTHPGLVDGDLIKAFIVSQAAGWGRMAELRTVDGVTQIAAATGYWQLLASVAQAEPDAAPHTLFAFIHGNEHSMLSLLQHPQPYDFHLPARADLPLSAGRAVIPIEVATRQMEAAVAATVAALTAMRRALPAMRLVHVMPPPPVASEAQIRRSPEVFAGHIERLGITPLALRLKIYALYQAVIGRTLAALGIEALAAPAAALNADGSLADAFVQGCTHGNAAYGALVRDQIAAITTQKVH